MILIADSGSTKTDWVLTHGDGQVSHSQKTEGINPFHQSEADIERILNVLTVADGQPLDAVFFYGSGVLPQCRPTMARLLAKRLGLSEERVQAESDMLGAARALCGHGEGIACILGTGANSCLYDGERICQNTPALGYVLGDEGSGALIGRNLLNAMYKGKIRAEIRERFEREFSVTMADVINRVYRQPLANRWMASLTPFISRHREEYPELSQLVVDCFRDFLTSNVRPYDRQDLPVSAIGSIAWYFQTELAHAASLECMRIGTICQTPMEGLLRYHQTECQQ